MIVTTAAALSYYLVTRYLPSGSILLSATDILLIVLATGVIGLAIRELVGGQPQIPA